VRQCIEKDPRARPPTVESILDQLDKAKTGDQRRKNRRLVVSAIVILSAIGLLTAGAFTLFDKSARSRVASASPGPPSLLVLPLANSSRDSGDASLSDGMTAELIGRLSANSNLRVVSGASVPPPHAASTNAVPTRIVRIRFSEGSRHTGASRR
jgi:hypothetical protein